jgi:threonine dehydratase
MHPTPGPTLDDVKAARAKLQGHVRTTPVIRWRNAWLKLEQLQLGGSFKARGAFNKLLRAERDALARGVVTASGGNHGLGVAVAAQALGASSTVFLPEKAPVSTEKRLLRMGARVERGGRAWDDAWARAVEHAGRSGALLVHPFDDPDVIAGQGTIGLELLEQVPDLDLVVVAIGGGGLVAGVSLALKEAGGVRVIGVEPTGATSMKDSLAAGRVVRLEKVTTIAGTLAPLAPSELTRSIAARFVDEVVLVSDEERLAAMKLLWDELRLLVEPAGAAALAAWVSGRFEQKQVKSPCILVCGANLDEELASATVRG